MPRIIANGCRVLAGVIVLFIAYVASALLCSYLFPDSARANKMEMVADKVGASVGILIASVFLRRYLLRSFRLALLCLAVTEIAVLVIILQFTGLTTPTLSDISFNVEWLYSLTWNVVVTFLLGAGVGHIWDQAANKALQATAAAPGS